MNPQEKGGTDGTDPFYRDRFAVGILLIEHDMNW